MEYLKKEKPSSRSKILFTGLDAAGKTSIILSLKREISKIAIIKPTLGVQRRVFEFLGKEISEWDLGGQASYRISYLKSPNKYFDKTEIAIYVIDVQNVSRLSESMSYLNDVVLQFENLNIKPPIHIFFHKYDHELSKDVIEDIDVKISNLKGVIKNITKKRKVSFYKTSILNLSTIYFVMSEILLALFPKVKLIQKAIKEFAKKFQADGIEFIDDNSLIIEAFYKDSAIKDILNASTPFFLNLSDSFESINTAENSEDQIIVQRFGKNFLFKRFYIRKTPYYLLIAKDNLQFNKEEFGAFVRLLTEILFK